MSRLRPVPSTAPHAAEEPISRPQRDGGELGPAQDGRRGRPLAVPSRSLTRPVLPPGYRAYRSQQRVNGAAVSGLVACVAWAALAGWVAAGVLLVLAHRRLERLERAHTARKWDIVALRAELGALRRRTGLPTPGTEADPAGPGPAGSALDAGPEPDAGCRPGELGGPGEPGGSSDPAGTGEHGGTRGPGRTDGPGNTGGTRRPTGATAWRRAHRPRSRPRRRPGTV